MSAEHVEPIVPHMIPPAAMMVPPSGFAIVSLKVTGAPEETTGWKVALQVRGSVIMGRPAGAQSPV
jgi:hypothetical protein